MSSSDTGALLVAAIANLAGLVVALAMWRRQRRRRRVLGSRHPAARPPLRVDLVDTDGGRRIRLAVPAGAPDLTIDIVSFRRRDPAGAWDSEPLEAPLAVASGSEVVLDSSLGADATAADVVVAWTARGGDGEMPGRQLFRVPAERATSTSGRGTAGLSGRAALALAALVAGALALVALSAWDGDHVEGGPALTTTTTAATIATTATPITAITSGSAASAYPVER